MNNRELGLVPYYSETLNYYSPLDTGALEWFDIDWPPSVLDLGCGDGRLADHVPDGVTILGIDCAEGRIRDAIRKRPGHFWLVGDLYDAPHSLSRFRLVCLFEVLEHMAKPLDVLASAKFARAPGGVVIGSVPINSPGPRHLQLFKTTAEACELLEPDDHQVHGRHLLMKWTK